jgi:hypothetical protein
MLPHQFYYQLAVVGLLWLFVMLHLVWPNRGVTPQTKPAKPITPRRQRSTDPKPFAGLTHKPHCALCEQEAAHPKAPPSVRPDPMPPDSRRPRTVDTSRHFCPHAGCAYRGWLGLGNLRANGHPSGAPVAPIPLHGLRGLLPGDTRDDLAWQAGPSGPHRACFGVPSSLSEKPAPPTADLMIHEQA